MHECMLKKNLIAQGEIVITMYKCLNTYIGESWSDMVATVRFHYYWYNWIIVCTVQVGHVNRNWNLGKHTF